MMMVMMKKYYCSPFFSKVKLEVMLLLRGYQKFRKLCFRSHLCYFFLQQLTQRQFPLEQLFCSFRKIHRPMMMTRHYFFRLLSDASSRCLAFDNAVVAVVQSKMRLCSWPLKEVVVAAVQFRGG